MTEQDWLQNQTREMTALCFIILPHWFDHVWGEQKKKMQMHRTKSRLDLATRKKAHNTL